MANTIKIKRGTNLSNAGTPATGELIYKSDTNELFVGDGSTAASSLTAIGGAGTSGSNNQLLTDDGSGGITSESQLTYNGAGQLQIHKDGSNAVLQLRSDDANTRIHFKEGSDLRWNVGYDAANNKFSFYDGATVFAIEDGAGANTLIVDSNSRVGIGTASPNTLLHLYGTSNTQMRLQTTGTGNSSNVIYQNGTASYTVGINSAEQFSFYSSQISDDAGFINTDGNLYWKQNILLSVNHKFLYSRDTNGTLTRMLGMNSGNTTYIGPIDSYAGGSVIYGISSNVSSHNWYTDGTARMTLDGNVLNLPNTGDWFFIKNNTNSGGLRFGTKDSGGNYANQIEISNTGNFVKLNENTTVTGTLTTTGNATIGNSSNPTLSIMNTAAGAGSGPTLEFGHNQGGGSRAAAIKTYLTNGSTTNRTSLLRFHHTQQNVDVLKLQLGDNYVRQYQKGDTSDYLETIVNDDHVNFHVASGNYVKISTDHGYLNLGPMNGSHCHFISDIGNFYTTSFWYINNSVTLSSYNQDVEIRRNNASADRINISADYTRIIVNNTERFRATTSGATVTGNLTTTAHLVLPYGEINDAGTDMNIVSDNALTLQSSAGTALTIPNASNDVEIHDDIWCKTNLGAIRFGASKQGNIYENNDDLVFSVQSAGQDMIFENLNSAGSAYEINLFIDGSEQRVGIGTTHPDTTLDITAGGANGIIINQDSNDATNSSRMFFKNTSGTYSMYKAGDYLRVNSGATAGGSTGSTNLISIGSNVGIGTASPSSKLHINTTDDGSVRFTRDGGSPFSIEHDASQLYFYNRTINEAVFLMSHSGPVVINEGGDDAVDFRVEGDTRTHLIFADASADKVGINNSTPYETLDVKSQSSTSPAIVANGAAANGCVHMAHGYAGQNGDYVNTYGSQYSSNATVLGYGVKPSTTANDTFLCSADNAAFVRGALVIDDELRFWQGAAANGTLNNNFSMTERFRLTAAGVGHFDNDVVAYSSTVSDKRLKENITTIDNALDKVMALRGVEYDWTATSRKGTHDIGLVAQEVEEVLPELVTEHELCTGEFGGEGNEKTFKTVNYDKMVGVLIEAIKEQQVQIDELKTKLGE